MRRIVKAVDKFVASAIPGPEQEQQQQPQQQPQQQQQQQQRQQQQQQQQRPAPGYTGWYAPQQQPQQRPPQQHLGPYQYQQPYQQQQSPIATHPASPYYFQPSPAVLQPTQQPYVSTVQYVAPQASPQPVLYQNPYTPIMQPYTLPQAYAPPYGGLVSNPTALPPPLPQQQVYYTYGPGGQQPQRPLLNKTYSSPIQPVPSYQSPPLLSPPLQYTYSAPVGAPLYQPQVTLPAAQVAPMAAPPPTPSQSAPSTQVNQVFIAELPADPVPVRRTPRASPPPEQHSPTAQETHVARASSPLPHSRVSTPQIPPGGPEQRPTLSPNQVPAAQPPSQISPEQQYPSSAQPMHTTTAQTPTPPRTLSPLQAADSSAPQSIHSTTLQQPLPTSPRERAYSHSTQRPTHSPCPHADPPPPYSAQPSYPSDPTRTPSVALAPAQHIDPTQPNTAPPPTHMHSAAFSESQSRQAPPQQTSLTWNSGFSQQTLPIRSPPIPEYVISHFTAFELSG
ncbi:hypothetical protein GP486_003539 [Trichoglossum hirsutum]|uniref:Uncharacterized protein n=1 Tax=Trichoglossum hirsutum TaxID=265104 RepID=A0A9P8LD13_9PEZI|nr:hypothetical protein GP486_003539 [Trichoglossum hirsutum]